MHYPLALFEMPGLPSMLVIAALGLLIFGKRLPEVGKSLGKGIVEFKKGLKGIEDEVDERTSSAAANRQQQFPPPQQQYQQPQYSQNNGQPVPHYQPAAPTQTATQASPQPQYKFDPFTGKPIEPVGASTESSAPPTA